MRRAWCAAAALVVGGSASAHCPLGDLDLDGFVGISDFLTILAEWGPCPDLPEPCLADLDRDGEVGIIDFLLLLGNWGPTDLAGGTFPGLWINGENCATEPDLHVHRFNDDTYVIRQSLCTNFEGPFLYLLFGQERALLLDSGTTGLTLAPTVYGIIDDWLAENNRKSIELIVANSHGHSDHTGNNSEFNGQPNTTVVGAGLANILAFFCFADWPNDIVPYDLGGRVLDVLGIPGHADDHIALYDRGTGLLLSGDTLYPGRLYISNFGAYVESIQRLVDFSDANEICQILGGHIEMSNTPGQDFPFGSNHHPDEHPLPMYLEHLLELHQGVIDMQDDPQIEVHDEFIIFPL